MRLRNLFYGIAYAALLTVAQNAGAQVNLELPWKAGQTWVVTQGYHQSFGGYRYAIDFAPTNSLDIETVAATDGIAYAKETNDWSATPCAAGEVGYRWRGPFKYVVLNASYGPIGKGSETKYAHLNAFTHGLVANGPGVSLKKGEALGIIGNSGCTHSTENPTSGTHLDFTRFEDGVGIPIKQFLGKVFSSKVRAIANISIIPEVNEDPQGGYPANDHYLSTNTGIQILSHPAGTLVQTYGEQEVYFLQKVGGQLVKRHVAESAMSANSLPFPEVVMISQEEKACYPKGNDLTGFERATQFANGMHEGQLIYLETPSPSGTPVFIVSNGTLHHVVLSADEFAFAGWSFSNVSVSPGPYSIGADVTLQSLTACPPPPTASPGPELTLTTHPLPPGHYDLDQGYLILQSSYDKT